jgi:putative FmdB family regulatory protein
MPTYDYSCLNCGKKFSVTHSIKEHVHKKANCPKCKSTKVERIVSGVLIKTSKKS